MGKGTESCSLLCLLYFKSSLLFISHYSKVTSWLTESTRLQIHVQQRLKTTRPSHQLEITSQKVLSPLPLFPRHTGISSGYFLIILSWVITTATIFSFFTLSVLLLIKCHPSELGSLACLKKHLFQEARGGGSWSSSLMTLWHFNLAIVMLIFQRAGCEANLQWNHNIWV